MEDYRKHNYNGRSRHQSSDERESRMEMTKLITNPDRSEKSMSKPGLRASAYTEGVNLSLHQCARNGDEHGMRKLLSTPMRKKINEEDEEYLTPLHYAARYNLLNIVKLLVEAGAEIDHRGKNRTTPLHYAAGFRYKFKREVSSDEDVCEPLPPPPETDFSEDEVESERLTEAYRAWEDRMSVSLDHIDDSERMRQMGASYQSLPNHSRQEKGGRSIVSYLVNKGADINAVDDHDQTPLHFAARRGNEEACRDLLFFKTKINIEVSEKQGCTPLLIAIIYEEIEVARLLIEAGANLMCQDKMKSTPLHYACMESPSTESESMEGKADMVQMLFDACIKRNKPRMIHEMVNEVDVMSSTPLHVAVENNNFQAVRLLLEKHSDINKARDGNMYPLHIAAQSANDKVAKLLLQNHAVVDALNQCQLTPLHIASKFNNTRVAQVLLKSSACVNGKIKNCSTPLLEAACNNYENMVELLLENGADFTTADEKDRTAVFLAAKNNSLKALQKLLSYSRVKELVNESDCFDNDPIHIAAEKGHLKVVQCLIKNKADINSKNEKEETPLHLASKNGRISIVQELINESNSCIYNEDRDSNTPLHLAAEHGNTQVVKVLMDQGADVYARNSDQQTALDLAASKGWTRTCHILLKKYPYVNFTYKSKTTPLHLASHNGHTNVVDLLLKHCSDVGLRDDSGKNCLDIAIDADRVSVAMVIVKSKYWKEALRNVTINPVTKNIDTPMRKLIRKMPDVALAVFNRCMSFDPENSEEKQDCQTTFDYEFLEDLYQPWIQERLKYFAGDRRSEITSISGSVSGEHNEDRLPLRGVPYSKDSNVLKENHPLFIMILSERDSLLEHPLVTTLLQHKWNTFGRFFYYLSFFIYIIFLIFLTAYMVTTDPPYLYGADGAKIEDNQCYNLTKPYEQSLCASIGTYVIIALAGFNLLKELFQIYQAKLKYFGLTNVIEWIVYVTSLLLVISFNECQRITGYRLVWQWNLGAVSVFLVWINLVLFIRKFPKFGIYVVMFTVIFQTFIQFFAVFFLFIVAYAMAFYTTFQNKAAFATFPSSLIKTYVMMTGEIEFDDIFHNPESGTVFYPEVSNILLIIFITSMSIIVMNLLIGLAVNDIKAVQDQAALKRMAMQVELALNVERILPDFIRLKTSCQKKTILPNKHRNPISQILADSYLDPKAIQKALHPNLDEMKKMKAGQDQLIADMKKFKHSIKEIGEQNHSLESMLEALMVHYKIGYKKVENKDEEDNEISTKPQVNETL